MSFALEKRQRRWSKTHVIPKSHVPHIRTNNSLVVHRIGKSEKYLIRSLPCKYLWVFLLKIIIWLRPFKHSKYLSAQTPTHHHPSQFTMKWTSDIRCGQLNGIDTRPYAACIYTLSLQGVLNLRPSTNCNCKINTAIRGEFFGQSGTQRNKWSKIKIGKIFLAVTFNTFPLATNTCSCCPLCLILRTSNFYVP